MEYFLIVVGGTITLVSIFALILRRAKYTNCEICNKSINMSEKIHITLDSKAVCRECFLKSGYNPTVKVALYDIKRSIDKAMKPKEPIDKTEQPLKIPKAASEMLEYGIDNNFIASIDKDAPHNIGIIAKNISNDEEVLLLFSGAYIAGVNDFYNTIFVVTDKRILYSGKKIWGEIFKSVLLEYVNDVTWSSAFGEAGNLTIETMKEKIMVMIGAKEYERISPKIRDIISNFKKRQNKPIMAQSTKSKAEEIKEYKSLLDDGIITQKEFEAKKKQLLDL